MPSRRQLLADAFGAVVALAGSARAAPALTQASFLGWTEEEPSVVAEHVRAVAIGAAHRDDGPLAAARLAARRRGHARGLALLSRWTDDALARAGVAPREAQAVHDALNAAAETARVRARADGSAIVEVQCPLSALRAAFDHRALPWHRP
ncbi:MAG: hypothetical protein ACK6CU_29630 [Deltaproteobacteria bacterium]|jgi:hypothetical protein